MKNLLLFIIILTVFVSCTKEIELNLGQTEKQLVVNCLFSEDNPWKVFLTQTKSTDDTEDPVVTNASVQILANGNNVIELEYAGDGMYESEQYPQKGVVYELRVDAPGYETISATNTIPADIEISDIDYSDSPTTYFFTNTMEDMDVAPLSFKLKSEDETFVRFRLYSFDSRAGYLYYHFPTDSVTVLKEKGIPDCCIDKLASITDSAFSYSGFDDYLSQISSDCGYYPYQARNMLVPLNADDRRPEAFEIDGILSTCNWAHNISIDFRTVLGTFTGSETADLFVDYIPASNKGNDTGYRVEYWLEVTGMNEDYYKYQESYIRQAFQAANPYTDVVQVHSNITNGVGIFAGYNQQMIHFFDY